MKIKLSIVLVTLLLCACPALATIYFDDGKTHNIDYVVNDHVYVDYLTPAMYTTVNLLDGGTLTGIYRLYGYEHSRINILGGLWYHLYSYDYSEIDMIDGRILSLKSYNFSRVDVFAGSIQFGIAIFDSSQVNISGGSVNILASRDSSYVNISGGSILYELESRGFSQVNITGGLIEGDLELRDQSMIQIFGFDFEVDGQPFGYGELTSIYGGDSQNEPFRHLTGTLLNGGLIDNYFRIGYDARIILIPEPATLLLLGLGGILLRKRHEIG